MIIGIGGISNAGKSRLAGRIKSKLSDRKVSVLCQDDYVFPKDKIPTIRDHIDWESPDSIDFIKYEKAVVEAVKNHDIVIIEGIFAFHYPSTNVMMDKRVFLTLDQRFFFMRKKNDLRWGKEPDWYIEHIWDSHIRYSKNNIPQDTLILRAGREIDIDDVIAYLFH